MQVSMKYTIFRSDLLTVTSNLSAICQIKLVSCQIKFMLCQIKVVYCQIKPHCAKSDPIVQDQIESLSYAIGVKSIQIVLNIYHNSWRSQSCIYIYKGELFVCLCACFSQIESQIVTKFCQGIRCTMAKKVMKLVWIDFPLVQYPLWGLSFQVCLRGSTFINVFETQTDIHLNGLDKLGAIWSEWSETEWFKGSQSTSGSIRIHPWAFTFIRETSARSFNEFN